MSAIVQYPVGTCDSKNGVRRKMRGQWFVQMRGQRFCADKKQKAEKRVTVTLLWIDTCSGR